jgi:hypothetical protein
MVGSIVKLAVKGFGKALKKGKKVRRKIKKMPRREIIANTVAGAAWLVPPALLGVVAHRRKKRRRKNKKD